MFKAVVFSAIAVACAGVIPTFALLVVMLLAWVVVIPTLAVFVVIADAWPVVIPTLAVFATTLELAFTSASV